MKLLSLSVALALLAVPALGSETEKSSAAESKDSVTFPEKFTVEVIDGEHAIDITKNHGSKVLVVNYWATFCGPCVEEMPYFEKVSKEYEPKDVRVVGYSLDFMDVETMLPKFLKDKGFSYPQYALPNVDPNDYIPKVSPNWSGALPATFLYDAKGNLLAEYLEPLEEEELRAIVKDNLNKISAEEVVDSASPEQN